MGSKIPPIGNVNESARRALLDVDRRIGVLEGRDATTFDPNTGLSAAEVRAYADGQDDNHSAADRAHAEAEAAAAVVAHEGKAAGAHPSGAISYDGSGNNALVQAWLTAADMNTAVAQLAGQLYTPDEETTKQLIAALNALVLGTEAGLTNPNLFSTDLIVSRHLASGSVLAVNIGAQAVTTAALAANSVTTVQLAADSVTAGVLKSNAVITSKVAAGAITADKITVSDLSALNATIGGLTITPTKLHLGTGTYNNANTKFYVDNAGFFSLSNKLTFSSTGALTVKGNITADSLTLTNSAGTTVATLSDASETRGDYNFNFNPLGPIGTHRPSVSWSTTGVFMSLDHPASATYTTFEALSSRASVAAWVGTSETAMDVNTNGIVQFTATGVRWAPPPVNSSDLTNKSYVDNSDARSAAARVATTQVIAASTNTNVIYNAGLLNVGWRNGPNTGFVVPTAGIYQVASTIVYSDMSAGRRIRNIIQVNGLTVSDADTTSIGKAGSTAVTTVSCTAGQTISVLVWHSDTVSRTLDSNTCLSVTRLG